MSIDTSTAARRVNGAMLLSGSVAGQRVDLIGRVLDASGGRATLEAAVRGAGARTEGAGGEGAATAKTGRLLVYAKGC